MEVQRRGEIALAFYMHQLRKDGIKVVPNMDREIGDIARAIGISFEEVKEFMTIAVHELVSEAFPVTDK